MNGCSSLKSLSSDVSVVRSEVSSFDQYLPHEPQRFCIHSSNGKRRGQGNYDFTVMPQRSTSPRSRQNSPPDVQQQSLQPLQEFDEDVHCAFIGGRHVFRNQRLNRFSAGRQFPVLVSPRFLPEFKRVTDAMEKRRVWVEVPKLPPPEDPTDGLVAKVTVSRATKRSPKTPRHNILPFIPSGNLRPALAPRTPGFKNDRYDSASEAFRQECRNSKGLQLHGAFVPAPKSRQAHRAFVPSCARPRQRTAGPLMPIDGRTTAPSMRGSTGGAMSATTSGWREAGIEKPKTEPTVGQRRESRESFSHGSHRSAFANTGGDEKRPGYHRMSSHRMSVTAGSAGLARRHSADDRGDIKKDAMIPIIAAPKPEDSLAFQMASELEKKQEIKQDTEKMSITIFKRMADEGKIHQDDIAKALLNLGFVNPQKDWIDKAFSKLTKWTSIGLDDFLQFLTLYEARQTDFYRGEFEKCDSDGSGTVESSELQELLRSLGLSPMRHVLQEIIDEVDTDQSGVLEFSEFEEVMTKLRQREGFTKKEFDEITELFQRFDRDGSGAMDTKEVRVALFWLGFSFTDDAADAIIAEIDVDHSGQIDSAEWIKCMRKVREAKIASLQEVMSVNDENGDGQIQYHELEDLLQSMGYVPDPEAVHEAAQDAGISPDDEDLDLGELWRILGVFREREGLSRDDLDHVERAFQRFAKAEDEEVDVMNIGRMIRSIGYVLNFEMQQDLTCKVDIDGSGRLDAREFRKMIRMIHQRDTELFRLSFQEAASHDGDHPRKRHTNVEASRCSFAFAAHSVGMRLTKSQAKRALQRVGCSDTDMVGQLFPQDQLDTNSIDFYGFYQAALRCRRNARAAFRENGGFTEDEISELRESFNRYDSDHSGQISGAETINLMEKEFPMISNDPARRPQVIQLLAEADEDGSGTLDFTDFLRMMRLLRDIQDQLRIKKELEAVTTTKFTPPEVQEFRELFLTAGDGMKELGFHEVKELLMCVVPMGTKNVEELKIKFDEFAAKQMGVLGDAGLLDFPEFLWLMRELINMNFANMNNRANNLAQGEDAQVT